MAMNKVTKEQLGERAAAALDKADTAELHTLFGIAVKDADDTMVALETIVQHYAGSSKSPRESAGPDAINAMREVALAAIDLARMSINDHAAPR